MATGFVRGVIGPRVNFMLIFGGVIATGYIYMDSNKINKLIRNEK